MLDVNYVDSGKYRGLVRWCRVMRWPAALRYALRGYEQADGGHRASDTLRQRILHGKIGRILLGDGLRDLGLRVTALAQRAACECSYACRCCQLPAKALALALDIMVVSGAAHHQR
jgi:hypothetical protein